MASESETLKKDIDDLRMSIDKLTKDVSSISQSLTKNLKDQATRAASDVRDRAASVASDIGEKGRESAAAMERTVQERPFQSLIVAFGAGLLLAQLLRKR